MDKPANSTVYHLNLSREQTRNAKIAFLPGDPGRVPRIAWAIHPEAEEIAYNREFRTFVCSFNNRSILVTSTGIGGPSASIAVEELAKLGVKSFIRVGTSGSIQEAVAVGDVVISSASVRLDGASLDYAPIEYPAVASNELTQALIEAARSLKLSFYVGITASQATFYPGQERSNTYSGYLLRRLKGATEEWRRLNVLNYEMESATLFVVCSTLGLQAACVTGVVNSVKREAIEEGRRKVAEERAIRVAVKALEFLPS